MAQELHGALQVGSERYGIVVSRFNEFITSKLLSGAVDCLKRHGAKEDQITVLWVPGSFEVPVAAQRLARSGKFAAVICLAAVIRGQTSHYDQVCQQITRGVGEVGLASGVPALFGVITADTLEEAIDRAGAKGGNMGFNAAAGAIEMVQVLKQFDNCK
ncbi:MAG: 6,7-dimethyl-8-ribityllumazine synthase [Planctomycetes bacterium ADurb.Bin412]|nr:MAG: 6,7-dimethyl-8-ribityllumazine synthase [Planctomycetes bacterium ADurb.Bin412]